jgi:hypothetical protein
MAEALTRPTEALTRPTEALSRRIEALSPIAKALTRPTEALLDLLQPSYRTQLKPDRPLHSSRQRYSRLNVTAIFILGTINV